MLEKQDKEHPTELKKNGTKKSVTKLLEGKVTGITKFGAFVELEEGKTGMVHISEVSNSYVEDINQFLKEGDVLTEQFINSLGKEEQEICHQLNRRTEFQVLRTTYKLYE